MNETIHYEEINAICQLLQWNDCYFRKIYKKKDGQIYIFFHDAKTMTSREVLRTEMNEEKIKEEKKEIAAAYKKTT